MASQKRVALDLHFLRNWVRNALHHVQALAFFISRGFTPVVLPIVDAALTELEEHSSEADTRAVARLIREEIADSIIEVLAYEKDIDRDVNIINGWRVAEKNILVGAISADTIMLAEAASFDVYALLTPRHCLTTAAEEKLKIALVDCGFSQSLVIFSPREIGEYLEERERRVQEAATHQQDAQPESPGDS